MLSNKNIVESGENPLILWLKRGSLGKASHFLAPIELNFWVKLLPPIVQSHDNIVVFLSPLNSSKKHQILLTLNSL